MKPREVLQEIRKMKFKEVYSLRTEGSLTVEEAASLLGVCDRTFRRYVAQYKEEGIDGLTDHRLATAAHNAAPVDEVMALVDLYKKDYADYQARGRSERMFRTLQGRLPLELQSAGVTTMEAANQFLKEIFLPEFNEWLNDATGEMPIVYTLFKEKRNLNVLL